MNILPYIIKIKQCKRSKKLLFANALIGFGVFSGLTTNAQTNGPLTLSSPNTTGNYSSNTSVTLSTGFTSTGPFSATIQIIDCIPLAINPTMGQNFVMTTVPRVAGYNSAGQLSGQGTCQVMQTIQYIDGIGRPLQIVQVKASPFGNDLVQPLAYDQFGRETTKYLPYALTGSSTSDGSYKTNALTRGAGQGAFYTSPPAGVAAILTPQSVSALEASPLSRVTEQGAPGNPWQLSTSGISGSGHTIKMIYAANDNVTYWARQYGVNIDGSGNRTLVFLKTYSPNQLNVVVTEDENWNTSQPDIHLNTTETYTDKLGHIVLKRTYNYANSALQTLSTYYVYDDLGNLCYVLPPASGADGTSAPNQTTLNNLCYQYGYDSRNRMFSKQLPGKGPEYMVYNLLDQVVYKQDANEAAVANSMVKWEYIKYDALGRVIMTGMDPQATTSTYSALQSFVTNVLMNVDTVKQWEISAPGGGAQGYTNKAFPFGPEAIPLTVNYYDDYTFTGKPATFITPTGVSSMTKGLLTGTLITVLNTMYNTTTPPDRLWTVHYYDGLGRDTITYSQHYLGGLLSQYNYDQISNTHDFTNEVTATTRKHYAANTGNTGATLSATINNTYVYDHMGRRTQASEQINGGNNVILSQVDYNEIGQVLTKHLHGTNIGSSFLQNIAYNYNERGWLLGSSAPLFQMQLQYNNVAGISGITPVAQYNGNIASQSWGTATSPNSKSYVYGYDQLNRLTSGTSTDNYKETGISYDLMGNITALSRYQANTLIDNLTYTYTNSGNATNQLQSIADASGNNTGLVNGTTAYSYDSNGNTLSNGNTTNTGQNKSYAYNLLNLPQVVIVPTGTITYTYDATGNKLRKVTVLSGTTKTTDYINGIEYDNSTSTIGFIQTEEGKVTPYTGGYDYTYYLGDNLGNTRVTFGTKTGVAVNYQADDYYPFGLEINRSVLSPKNEYLYNKKELQEELTQYDYGARFYDPVIGRWNTVDPLSEINRRWSPYNYVENNPIKMIDPDGMESEDGEDGPQPIESSETRQEQVGRRYFYNILLIGKYHAGDDNISTDASRFAQRGATDDSKDPILHGGQDGNGTQSNAFRHTLWQASITSEFGGQEAKAVGDAHEANPNTDLRQRSFKTSVAADQTVDLLNNIIGRGIGDANKGIGMKDMALHVLSEFAKNGLYTASQQKDGSWLISKGKITSEQFKTLQARFKALDDNGETKKEADKRKKRDEDRKYSVPSTVF